jgi:hypothetical protein
MATNRDHLHELVDRLAATQVPAVRQLLEAMLDPVSRAIANAPVDDEPESEAERQAVAEAREWRKHHKPISMEEVLADIGLTSEDFHKMAETPVPSEPRRRG